MVVLDLPAEFCRNKTTEYSYNLAHYTEYDTMCHSAPDKTSRPLQGWPLAKANQALTPGCRNLRVFYSQLMCFVQTKRDQIAPTFSAWGAGLKAFPLIRYDTMCRSALDKAVYISVGQVADVSRSIERFNYSCQQYI